MRTFVYGELRDAVVSPKDVAFCYEGGFRRGSIALMINGSVTVITPDGYDTTFTGKKDNSGFELWALIEEMTNPDLFHIRQEAVDRFYDLYNSMYQYLPILQSYPFAEGH